MRGDVASLEAAVSSLIGTSVQRPSGGLAGHSAALPFESHVEAVIKSHFPGRSYKHFELLNHIFSANPEAVTYEQRTELLGGSPLQALLARGKDPTNSWSKENLYKVKQNDTAELVIVPRPTTSLAGVAPVWLIDVKTKDLSISGQPPNIISARKIADASAKLLESGGASQYRISYAAIRWTEQGSTLRCEDAKVVWLDRIPPHTLYINWVAAQQIQFDPYEVSQEFDGEPIEWAAEFLQTFCAQLDKRIQKQISVVERYKLIYQEWAKRASQA